MIVVFLSVPPFISTTISKEKSPILSQSKISTSTLSKNLWEDEYFAKKGEEKGEKKKITSHCHTNNPEQIACNWTCWWGSSYLTTSLRIGDEFSLSHFPFCLSHRKCLGVLLELLCLHHLVDRDHRPEQI